MTPVSSVSTCFRDSPLPRDRNLLTPRGSVGISEMTKTVKKTNYTIKHMCDVRSAVTTGGIAATTGADETVVSTSTTLRRVSPETTVTGREGSRRGLTPDDAPKALKGVLRRLPSSTGSSPRTLCHRKPVGSSERVPVRLRGL